MQRLRANSAGQPVWSLGCAGKDMAGGRESDGGSKYRDLILLSASIFSWFFPSAKPSKIPEATGAPCCVHADVDGLQPQTSRNTSAIEQLIGVIAHCNGEECTPRRTLLSLTKGMLGLISRMGAAGRYFGKRLKKEEAFLWAGC